MAHSASVFAIRHEDCKGVNEHVEDESHFSTPLYQTDEFKMFCWKVLPCSKRYCHDWTQCPFAHPGEKAKRRDCRVYSYTGVACPDMKKAGSCSRGDSCPYSHNVFEFWLHPSRYRTQLCNDGTNCKRKVCFFAHTLEQLRVPASSLPPPPPSFAAGCLASHGDAIGGLSAAPAAHLAGLPGATGMMSPMRFVDRNSTAAATLVSPVSQLSASEVWDVLASSGMSPPHQSRSCPISHSGSGCLPSPTLASTLPQPALVGSMAPGGAGYSPQQYPNPGAAEHGAAAPTARSPQMHAAQLDRLMEQLAAAGVPVSDTPRMIDALSVLLSDMVSTAHAASAAPPAHSAPALGADASCFRQMAMCQPEGHLASPACLQLPLSLAMRQHSCPALPLAATQAANAACTTRRALSIELPCDLPSMPLQGRATAPLQLSPNQLVLLRPSSAQLPLLPSPGTHLLPSRPPLLGAVPHLPPANGMPLLRNMSMPVNHPGAHMGGVSLPLHALGLESSQASAHPSYSVSPGLLGPLLH